MQADASIGPYSDEMMVFVRVDVRICQHNAKKAQPKLNVIYLNKQIPLYHQCKKWYRGIFFFGL